MIALVDLYAVYAFRFGLVGLLLSAALTTSAIAVRFALEVLKP